MPDDKKKRHDLLIAALITSGLIALRRSFQVAFILRLLQLTTEQVIVEADRIRAMTVLQSELSDRTGYNGLVYETIVSSINKAGPDVVDYETTVTDDFGLVLTSRIERAKNQLLDQVDKVLISAIEKEEPRRDAQTEVFNIIARHSGFKRVMAYDTARAYNLQLLAMIIRSNADYLRIQLSEDHNVDDICDGLVGVFPVSEFTGEPFRRLPPFHPFCKCYVLPFRS